MDRLSNLLLWLSQNMQFCEVEFHHLDGLRIAFQRGRFLEPCVFSQEEINTLPWEDIEARLKKHLTESPGEADEGLMPIFRAAFRNPYLQQ